MSARRGLVALGSALTALLVWAACSGGLALDEGNAFPCQYEVPEEERDTQCPAQWRCGIDGRCHEAAEELDPLGKEPSFPEGVRRFPKLLTGEARLVAGDPIDGRVLVWYGDGGTVEAHRFIAQPVSGLSTASGAAFAGEHLVVMEPSTPAQGGEVAVLDVNRLTGAFHSRRPVRDAITNQALKGARALRALSVEGASAAPEMLVLLRERGEAGEVHFDSDTYTPFPGTFSPLGDGSIVPCGAPLQPPCGTGAFSVQYMDVRPVPLTALLPPPRPGDTTPVRSDPVPVAATPAWFLWRSPADAGPGAEDGRWQLLNPDDPIALLKPDGGFEGGEGGLLRHSDNGGVWALRMTRRRDVLSTWVLSRSQLRPEEPRLERAWDDCSPCGDGRLITFVPVSDGAIGVEVLCESLAGGRSLFRIVGASVVTPEDLCLRQPLEASVDLTEIAGSPPDGGPGGPGGRGPMPIALGGVDETHGYALTIGGSHGQLWHSRTLSTLRPLFLDRAPLAVGLLPAGGLSQSEAIPVAVTRDFVAVRPPELQQGSWVAEMVVPRVVQRDGGPAELERLGAVVQGTPGWLLLETGQLARVSLDEGGEGVSVGNAYGPTLLGPSGELAQGPFLGQGIAMAGGGVSLVLAAEDQLYYLDTDLSQLESEPELAGVLNPRLTPDPNFPVRSLARDRTIIPGGDSPVRVRGWVATSRGVFQFEQATATGAWTLQSLPLGAGEPVEVWARGSHGRVGLRDGQVLRLPEGLPLTQPLSEVDRVVDYDTLGGWPVALGEEAVYQTLPTTRADGSPGLLRWAPIPLPAELVSQGLSGARIAVLAEGSTPVLYLFTRTGFVYKLGEAAR